MENSSIASIVEMLIKALVDDPDQVQVSESKGEQTVIFEARVSKNDMGKVIGRHGRTIEALRTIVGACGSKRKQRCIFQVLDIDEDKADDSTDDLPHE